MSQDLRAQRRGKKMRMWRIAKLQISPMRKRENKGDREQKELNSKQQLAAWDKIYRSDRL